MSVPNKPLKELKHVRVQRQGDFLFGSHFIGQLSTFKDSKHVGVQLDGSPLPLVSLLSQLLIFLNFTNIARLIQVKEQAFLGNDKVIFRPENMQ